MTTPPPDLRAAARSFLQQWNDYLDANPEAENNPDIAAALNRGELPPNTAVTKTPIRSLPDLTIKELSPLWTTYRRAIDHGWKPKKAIYIAWSVHPRKVRKEAGLPETEDAMAIALGSRAKKDQGGMFRAWRMRDPEIDEYIFTATRESPLAHYRHDLIDAMIKTGVMIGREGYADRKMVLEMTGDYARDAKGTEGDPVHVAHPGIESALDRIYNQDSEGDTPDA